MTKALKMFYASWMEKANNTNTDTINGIFDKFISLYVPYNALYDSIPAVQVGGYGDQRKATQEVVAFLDANALLNELTAKHNDDINEFIDILAKMRFNIRLKQGMFHRPYDVELLRELQSADVTTKVTAILKFIYFVRCNLIHGSKELDPIQSQVVLPVTRIHTTVLTKLYDKLNL
ncbi:MAG: hypothetical protein QM737_12765 [Ferruginibacter sp.]